MEAVREAIVLAGGFGTRLRPAVEGVPKPMAPVGGRPFLGYLLDELLRGGYRHVVLATGYLHEQVEAYFGCAYHSLKIDYAVEHTPLGTGGAMRNALEHCCEDAITVLNGDTLFRIDHSRLIAFAEQHDTPLALVLRRVEDAGRYGAVECNAEGRVVAFREKSATAGSSLINGGIYRLRRSLLEGYSLGQAFSFETDLMQRQYASQPFFAYAESGYFIDIGVPADYARAQHELPLL
ncbi:MAG: nucleotidyltransferase family protein [Bacteroidales bacterium]|nr:nucleotidyltransferase family protein [Bacteroidales bacterium]